METEKKYIADSGILRNRSDQDKLIICPNLFDFVIDRIRTNDYIIRSIYK